MTGQRLRLWLAIPGVLAAALLLYRALGYTPLVLGGKHMEGFCEGLRKDMSQAELKAAAQAEGYRSVEQTDKQGSYLRINDPTASGSYHCEARFKPDGMLASVNFTAKAQH